MVFIQEKVGFCGIYVGKNGGFVVFFFGGGGSIRATLFRAPPVEFSCHQYLQLGIDVLLMHLPPKSFLSAFNTAMAKGQDVFYIIKFQPEL